MREGFIEAAATKRNKLFAMLQVAALAFVILLGILIIWLASISGERSRSRTEELARVQFELTKADICANISILAIEQSDRGDAVQHVMDHCLGEVNLPGTRIEVPVANGS